MSFGPVEITGGAALFLALLYYFDDTGLVPCMLASCLLHELGHIGAICALGGRVRRVRVSCAGAALALDRSRPLSAGRMMAVALAGPGANLALAWLSANLAHFGWGPGLYLLAGLNLGLALFNLLPVCWLDGGAILENLFLFLGVEAWGDWVVTLLSEVVIALLLGGGLALLWASGGHSFTLLMIGLWMAWGVRREEKGAAWG